MKAFRNHLIYFGYIFIVHTAISEVRAGNVSPTCDDNLKTCATTVSNPFAAYCRFNSSAIIEIISAVNCCIVANQNPCQQDNLLYTKNGDTEVIVTAECVLKLKICYRPVTTTTSTKMTTKTATMDREMTPGTTEQSSSTTTSKPKTGELKDEEQDYTAVFVGVAIALVVLMVLAVIIAILLLRRRRQKKEMKSILYRNYVGENAVNVVPSEDERYIPSMEEDNHAYANVNKGYTYANGHPFQDRNYTPEDSDNKDYTIEKTVPATEDYTAGYDPNYPYATVDKRTKY